MVGENCASWKRQTGRTDANVAYLYRTRYGCSIKTAAAGLAASIVSPSARTRRRGASSAKDRSKPVLASTKNKRANRVVVDSRCSRARQKADCVEFGYMQYSLQALLVYQMKNRFCSSRHSIDGSKERTRSKVTRCSVSSSDLGTTT